MHGRIRPLSDNSEWLMGSSVVSVRYYLMFDIYTSSAGTLHLSFISTWTSDKWRQEWQWVVALAVVPQKMVVLFSSCTWRSDSTRAAWTTSTVLRVYRCCMVRTCEAAQYFTFYFSVLWSLKYWIVSAWLRDRCFARPVSAFVCLFVWLSVFWGFGMLSCVSSLFYTKK